MTPMTNVLRRAFYAALGALAVYAWRRVQDAERAMPAAEAMATVVVTIPKSILPPMILGLGVEVQGLLLGDVLPATPPDDDAPTGLDPNIWGDGS